MNLALFYGISLFVIILAYVTGSAIKNNDLKKRCFILFILVNVICLIIYTGKIAFAIFVLLVAFVGTIELSRLIFSSISKSLILAVLVLAVLSVIYLYTDLPWYLLLVFLHLYLALSLMKSCNITNKIIVWACIALIVVPGCAALFYLFEIEYTHIIALILLVQFNDGFSYLAGKKFGRTHIKFISSISPNKTLEGYFGGIFGTLLALLILNSIIPAYPKEGSLIRAISLVISVFIYANAGDLAFSAIKRRLKIKDFSNLLSSHGGVLDRFDSMLFLAPIYLFMLKGGII